jgi:hypothetical protein
MKRERKSEMAAGALPGSIADIEALEEILSRPDDVLQRELRNLDGDIMVLGVGGKMGPSLARMAKRAAPDKRVIGVARFSEAGLRQQLDGWGIETIQCDLMDRAALQALPKAKNIVFMAGMKFGATGDQPRTWAMNTYLPGMVAEEFTDARIVASPPAASMLCRYRRNRCYRADTAQSAGQYANSRRPRTSV